MSVPPDDAPQLNIMAEPIDVRRIAYTSSRNGWSDMGLDIGTNLSKSHVSAENIRLQYTVLIPVMRPRKINPIKSSAMFIVMISVAGVKREILPITVPIPLTPPVEKPLGILKKYTPTVRSNTPAFIIRKSSAAGRCFFGCCCKVCCCAVCCIDLYLCLY